MPKNTDPPGYHSREITHHIVGQFKNHFSGTTDAGFRCHCGHKGGVQFTDYQAMTSPVAWELPSVVCDRVIAAWRAHTKDLDGVHPNAEDQIRDFFSRHLERPGGPTVTTPRYPLTAIPLGTPKPKSLTISALVDEDLRRIIVNYAEKLDIAVVPVESRSFEWLVTDRHTSLKSATATAMREYLARLLGAEAISEETPPLELANTSPSDSQVNLADEIRKLAIEAAAQGKSTFRVNVDLPGPLKYITFDITFDIPLKTGETSTPQKADGGKTEAAPITKIPDGTHLPSHITIVESNTRPKWGTIEVIRAIAGELNIPCGYLGQINRSFVGNHPWVVTEEPCSADFLCGAKVVTAEAMRDFLHAERDRAWAKKQGEVEQTPKYDSIAGLNAKTVKDWTEAIASIDRPTRIILRSYAADDKPYIERLLGLARQLQIPVQLAGPWSCTAFPTGEEAHPALDVVFPEVLVHPRDVLIVAEGQQPLTEIENQLLWETREQDQRFITGLIERLGIPADASRGDIAAAVEAKGGDSEIGVVTSRQLAACHRQRVRYEECDAQVREILGASQGEEAVEAAKRVTAELAEWKRELASWKADTTALRQETAENQRKLLDILRAGTVEPSWERCISYTEARMKDTISERDALKEQLETAITAERQTIAQRIDLTLTGNAAVTNLDTMLRAVEACREGYTREASNNVNLRRDCEMLQGFIGQIADALDAPPGDRLVVKDDGSLNTALVDRVVGYFKRLYTAAGFTEPPQGGWSEILSNVEDTLAGECPLPSR